MDGLSLDALNLSTTEQSLYTQAFRELAELSDQDHPEGYHMRIMLTRIPEVRGWFKDRFFTLSLGQIDQVSSCTCQSRRHSGVWQILQMTCVQDSSSIHMTGVQFFASLRIALHAEPGAGVVLKSAFKQGTYYLFGCYMTPDESPKNSSPCLKCPALNHCCEPVLHSVPSMTSLPACPRRF